MNEYGCDCPCHGDSEDAPSHEDGDCCPALAEADEALAQALAESGREAMLSLLPPDIRALTEEALARDPEPPPWRDVEPIHSTVTFERDPGPDAPPNRRARRAAASRSR